MEEDLEARLAAARDMIDRWYEESLDKRSLEDLAESLERASRAVRAVVETEEIEIDLSEEDWALIAKAAHLQDVTINRFINEALARALEEYGDEPDE